MTIEYHPVGVLCNLACTYCYEHPQRDPDGGRPEPYDLEAAWAQLERFGVGRPDWRQQPTGFTLFGGEPLLMPLADLERLLARAAARQIPVGVQTNGALLSPAHWALLARYRVHLGISVDGPGELNRARWAGSPEKTDAMTARTLAAIAEAQRRRHPHSIIITLHRHNAVGDRLERLIAWIAALDAGGTPAARLHTLEVDDQATEASLALTSAEALTAFRALRALERRLATLRFDVFREIRALLLGQDSEVSCVWHACDPWTTAAVQAVGPRGEPLNCHRTYKDGVLRPKADMAGHERQLALWITPQEDGGCAGCRFWLACQGYCPGTGLRQDWRFRTRDCRVLQGLFEDAEQELVQQGAQPISLHPDRPRWEERAWQAWAAGTRPQLAALVRGESPGPGAAAAPRDHGDHWDAPDGYQHTDGSHVVHGDAGTTVFHGDQPHGDHTDG